MTIEAKEFDLKMSYGELWTLACTVKNHLLNTIKTHWVNHQKNWRENAKEDLSVISRMFIALGRPDMIESFEFDAKIIFDSFNAKTK